MASVLGFIGGPQERSEEQRSQKKQAMVVQGRRCRHPGVGNFHGATLLPEAGVHSLTSTCFLTCDVGTPGVRYGAALMGCSCCQPHAFHQQSACPTPYTPFVLRCIFYIPATDSEDTTRSLFPLSYSQRALLCRPTQDSLSAALAPFIPRSLYNQDISIESD